MLMLDKTEEENVSTQPYIVFPLWSSISSSYKISDDKAKDYTVDDDACRKTVQEPASEYDQALQNVLDKMMNQEKEATEQSDAVRKDTPVNTASTSRTFSPVGPSSGPSFVPFGGSFPIDAANLPHDPLMPELEDIVDFNNMEPSIVVSPIPTTRVHTTHPKAQIIGDPKEGQITKIPRADYLLVSFLNMNPQRYLKPLMMKVGLKQCKRSCFSSRFKRVEAIRIFLAFASFMNFPMYQMDVKSAFLYGTIEEEVYVCQPLGFADPKFPKKVYKVENALYGLHQAPRAWYETLSTYLLDNGFHRGQIDKTLFIKRLKGDILLVQVYVDDIIFVKQKEDGIFISQDKYVAEILKKFGFSSVRTASTPMETNKALTKDEDGEDVDVHLYSDYAGASLDRKSTIGGCQFLGSRLISWQCKKQTVVANSTTKAEYIAASHCCKRGRDTKIPQSGGPPRNVGDEVATTPSSFEAEQDSGSGPWCQETTLGM
ncbi:putative ribonuclease H-like domain-containing protein [Tanacetum coccineum]